MEHRDHSPVSWRHSLRFRLVAAALTVECLMLAILLGHSFRLLHQAIESQAQARLEALVPLLDAALAGRVFQRDLTEVEAILNRLTSSPTGDIRYIAVFDQNETIIAGSGPLEQNWAPKEDHNITEALTDLTYDTRLPLTIAQTQIGTVHFGLSLHTIVSTQKQVVRDGIGIAAIEIILSFLLLTSGGYLITRHLHLLTEGARKVAQGDYSTTLSIPGHDEIALLADNFNTMANAVASHINELQSSEMRSTAIFNSVNEAIFIHDAATGMILDVNERMCKMFACTHEEALRSSVDMLSSGTPPFNTEGVLARIRAALEVGPQVFDWHARSTDGRLFWVEVSLRKARIGEEDRLIAVVRDISDRKQIEDERIRAFSRFTTVVDSLDALVYVADMQTYEVLFINKFGRRTWGDVTGQTCWQTLQKDQSGPCPFCTNHLLLDASGHPCNTIIWELQNTATQDWFECRDQAIPWTDGRFVRMEIALNITRRKKAEEELAEEKEQLAVTLRSIGDGVITTDIHGRIVLMNTVAEQLTGWTQQEAAGQPLTDIFRIIHEHTRQPSSNPAEKVVNSGQIVALDNHTLLIARDGKERSITDSGAPIRNREGHIMGVVLVFRDDTEKRQQEEEQQKLRKLESVGILAGGIAHDFNNILTAILGNINLALLDPTLPDALCKLLTDAEKASIRAKDLTQQLLTFSKGGEPVKTTSKIGDIIRDSAEFVLHGSSVACRYDIPEDLWLVDIDKGQISQVIQNIIINAKHAMPDGGTIEVCCKNVDTLITPGASISPTDTFIKIDISDTGTGIPAHLLDRIFDPYFTTKQDGSGLGLAITHAIITKHGGYISVQSQPGSKTTFTLYLPASAQAPEPQVEEIPPAIGRKARILIMDDEEQVRSVTKAILEALGHEAILTCDGQEAINVYLQHEKYGEPIDLLLMDLTIPGGMGGKDAAEEILRINPTAKVVVSSGYSNDPIMARHTEYGFYAAIAKPFRVHDLQSILSHLFPQ